MLPPHKPGRSCSIPTGRERTGRLRQAGAGREMEFRRRDKNIRLGVARAASGSRRKPESWKAPAADVRRCGTHRERPDRENRKPPSSKRGRALGGCVRGHVRHWGANYSRRLTSSQILVYTNECWRAGFSRHINERQALASLPASGTEVPRGLKSALQTRLQSSAEL
jgi:hypothetical protein